MKKEEKIGNNKKEVHIQTINEHQTLDANVQQKEEHIKKFNKKEHNKNSIVSNINDLNNKINNNRNGSIIIQTDNHTKLNHNEKTTLQKIIDNIKPIQSKTKILEHKNIPNNPQTI